MFGFGGGLLPDKGQHASRPGGRRLRRACGMLAYVLYALAALILAPLGLLYLVYIKRRDEPYGLSGVRQLLGSYPDSCQGCVVFHTVSVGEVIAARPLIQKFIEEHPAEDVIVTTTTTTGAAEARKIEGARHFFAPLDSPLAVRGFLRSFRPRALFIMETELWPNLLRMSHARGIRISVFNARMPEKTCRRYLLCRSATEYCISSCLDLVLCQSESDRERFVRIGVEPQRCHITHSLKYDLRPSEELFARARELKKSLQLSPCLGAISTHDGEEAMVLETFMTLREKLGELKLVLVPRHQSSNALAMRFLRERGIPYSLKTDLERDLSDFKTDILIGNTIGEIEFYLGLCDLVFMGGSLVDVGGHNPLEPAYFSLPIISGPYYYNFQDLYDSLIAKKGAFLAQDHLRLYSVVVGLLRDRRLTQYGMNAMDVQQQGRGALTETLTRLHELLATAPHPAAQGDPESPPGQKQEPAPAGTGKGRRKDRKKRKHGQEEEPVPAEAVVATAAPAVVAEPPGALPVAVIPRLSGEGPAAVMPELGRQEPEETPMPQRDAQEPVEVMPRFSEEELPAAVMPQLGEGLPAAVMPHLGGEEPAETVMPRLGEELTAAVMPQKELPSRTQ